MDYSKQLKISTERKSQIILLVANLIKELNINELPIRIEKVYKELNYDLIPSNDINQTYRKDDFLKIKSHKIDAITIYHKRFNDYITTYDENIRYERKKFTFAHELGHIVLNHFIDYNDVLESRNISEELYRILENEADFFAAEFLAPLHILKLLNANSIEDVISISSISKQAASRRLFELKNYKSNSIYSELANFYTKQFDNYIIAINRKNVENKNRHRIMQHINPIPKTVIDKYCYCGNTGFKDSDWVCNKCGHKLITRTRNIVEFEYDKNKITEEEFNYIMDYLKSSTIERNN